MSELKILIHIGHHLNVVNLLGACTKAGGEESSVNQEQKRKHFSDTLGVWKCLWGIHASTAISSSLLTGELLLLLKDVASSHLNLSRPWCHLSVLPLFPKGLSLKGGELDCTGVPNSSLWAFRGFSLSFPALSGGCIRLSPRYFPSTLPSPGKPSNSCSVYSKPQD